jgi:CheY-like chemotaxis protein
MESDRTMQVQGKILAVDDDPNNITILKALLDDNYDLKADMTSEQTPVRGICPIIQGFAVCNARLFLA